MKSCNQHKSARQKMRKTDLVHGFLESYTIDGLHIIDGFIQFFSISHDLNYVITNFMNSYFTVQLLNDISFLATNEAESQCSNNNCVLF